MSRIIRLIAPFFIFIFILAACNLPSQSPATEAPNAVFTAAALTVQAMSTQSTGFSTPTLAPPLATNTSVSFPTLALPTSTVAAPPTASCDLAQFVRDVSIPDGTVFAPGATFTKTWRLKNVGTCTWTGYQLVFDSGDSMGGTSPTPVGTVSQSQEVDLSVNLTAPSTNGSYRGYWRIRNGSGALVPVLGGTNGQSFFVDIKVGTASSGFDFYTRAGDATWVSSAGAISFNGSESDTNGFAKYQSGKKLEDGNSSNKILEIYPQMVDNGWTTGLYPSYTVVSGEHFLAKIGFLAKDASGACGLGNVKFQLNYKLLDVITTLREWTDTCDGTLKDADVDLSTLAGKNVKFALEVVAVGPSTDASAVWISPRIQIP